MFLEKIKKIILNIDKKFFRSSIINSYLEFKYYIKVREVYALMGENVFEKKKETLFKQRISSLSHLIFKKVQNII